MTARREGELLIDPQTNPATIKRRFHIMAGQMFKAGAENLDEAMLSARIIRDGERVSVYVLDTSPEPGDPRLYNLNRPRGNKARTRR